MERSWRGRSTCAELFVFHMYVEQDVSPIPLDFCSCRHKHDEGGKNSEEQDAKVIVDIHLGLYLWRWILDGCKWCMGRDTSIAECHS